jgi:hypothetical protein
MHTQHTELPSIQVPLFTVLEKYDGSQVTVCSTIAQFSLLIVVVTDS